MATTGRSKGRMLGGIVFDHREINTYAADVEYYFQRYGDIELHRRMIADRWRTDAFARAIEAVVTPEDVVLDVGTGTGVLAMLAARAGARQVYAIDQAEVAQTAANLVKANKLGDVVKILRGPAAELELPESATVLVSEWLGNFAFVEAMLDDVLAARDANLAPGGRMIPSRVRTLLAPLDDSALFFSEGPGFWRKDVRGLDFSSLEAIELQQGRANQFRVDTGSLLCPGVTMTDLDLDTATSEAPFGEGVVHFEIERDGVLNGVAGWFEAQLAEDVWLDTGPHEPETHWAQTYMPCAPRPVKAGDRLEVGYALTRDPEEPRYLLLELTLDEERHTYRLE